MRGASQHADSMAAPPLSACLAACLCQLRTPNHVPHSAAAAPPPPAAPPPTHPTHLRAPAPLPPPGPQMMHKETQATYSEVEGLALLLGYRTANAGCCKVILHPKWGSYVYPATLIARAPAEALKAAIKGAEEQLAAKASAPTTLRGGAGEAPSHFERARAASPACRRSGPRLPLRHLYPGQPHCKNAHAFLQRFRHCPKSPAYLAASLHCRRHRQHARHLNFAACPL
jgi:hypothetical protein